MYFCFTKSFTVSMPLIFHVDQFICEFRNAIQGLFHRGVFLGSDIGSCKICFIIFHVVNCEVVNYLSFILWKSTREKILGMSMRIINTYPLLIFSVFNNKSQVKALGGSLIQFEICKVKTTLRFSHLQNFPIYCMSFICPFEVCYGRVYFLKECLHGVINIKLCEPFHSKRDVFYL